MSSDCKQTPDEFITEVCDVSNRFHLWLIVEGESDEKLLLQDVSILGIKIFATDGWENVMKIITECHRIDGKIVVGLIDRDYRDFDNSQPINENIVLTDLIDIENILFESSALNKVLVEHGSRNKLPKLKNKQIDFEKIKSIYSNIAEQIGRFRAYCYKNKNGISFKKMKYLEFINKDLEFDASSFIKYLSAKNQKKITMIDWNNSQGNWIEQKYNVPVFIRNGHDLMELIVISLRSLWSNKGGSLEREDIESYFRLAFTDTELKRTNFWQSIHKKFMIK